MAAAWQLLKEQKQLLLLPIASSVCLLLLTGAWAIPVILGVFGDTSWPAAARQSESLSSLGAFLFYVVTYGIGIFFNAALAICVLRKVAGKPVSILDGLREAAALFPQILGWALLSATVGVLLRTIERRSGFIGGVVTSMLGFAWTIVTFLVVPILVAEHKGPLDAVWESAQLLRRTWGEDLLGGMGFGALYFLWALPGVLGFVIGASMIASHLVLAIIMVLSILYFPLLGLVLSTLSTIFDVVRYRYTKLANITPGFDRDLLESSFVTKRAYRFHTLTILTSGYDSISSPTGVVQGAGCISPWGSGIASSRAVGETLWHLAH